ncbi:MAG: beta-glucanase (GH16 family) [Mariniblastus sp.]|jgi:beta-glucanase (GH16 family)
MPHLRILIAALILSFPSLCFAQPQTRSGFDISWFDEFDSNTLNTELWTAANTNVTTNNSLQDYLPEQVSVETGNLVIRSENSPSRGLPYRSGLVTSNTTQKHGRWDVRAKLPTSKGMWPAIWLLADAPWPSQGEIDIMENRGDEATMTSSAFHYGTNPPFSHQYKTKNQTTVRDGVDANYHNDFHTYSVEWDPNQIRFYVDDVHHWSVRDSEVGGFLSGNVGDMRLIINTAVGGEFLDNPDDSTVWNQEFKIDYVHAYSKSNAPRILSFENGGFESQGGSLAGWSKFGDEINNVSTGNERILAGDESLKLYGQFNGETNYSGIEQGLTVTAGQMVSASADAFVASIDSLAGTSNQVELKIDYYSEQYGAFGSDDYISSESILLTNADTMTDEWLSRFLESIVPAGAVEARLAIVFTQQGNASGSTFIDNVNFTVAVPEPSALGLLGLGAVSMGTRRRRLPPTHDSPVLTSKETCSSTLALVRRPRFQTRSRILRRMIDRVRTR